jgi:hypothetical protein
MKKIYKVSKWIHKWISIILSLFLIWMSISGILLNHPEMISGINVPKFLLPSDYDLINWNRSAIIEAKFSESDKKRGYFAGHEGVLMTEDGGYSFKNLNINGYPESAYYKKTKTISIFESDNQDIVFAGNFGGLYKYINSNNSWEKENLPESNDKVVKVIPYNDSIIVFTDSEMFISKVSNNTMEYKKIPLVRNDENPSMTMIEFFFQLHSGELWGLPGKLVFDIGALILIFLSISGLYIWLFPKYRRFKIKHNFKKPLNHTGWFYRNHLKIGIWSFALLMIFAVTGLFMRPPLIAVLLDGDIAAKYIPAPNPTNPWKHRIRNAMYDKSTNRIIIDTKDGYWISDSGIYGTFTNELPPVPIFAMGATVLQNDDEGNLLLGSFAGLYKIANSGFYAENVLDADAPLVSSVRPGANLITGYFKDPSGFEFVTTHFGGLMNVQYPGIKTSRYKMPEFLTENYSMSLWNYLFEIHNGRIFQALIGEYYILIIPLTALMFIMLLITGVFDWLYLKFRH